MSNLFSICYNLYTVDHVTHFSGGTFMKCIRVGLEADVYKFEFGKGLEDGYELLSDVVTQVWIETSSLLKVMDPNGNIECPYITHRRGRTFIEVDDYIIIDSDGTKHVCGSDKIFLRYKPIE